MAELEALPEHLNALVFKLSEQERKKLLMQVARKIRQSQKTRITQQSNPDGSKYIPRKNLRGRKGKIKQRMFNQIKNAKYLRIEKIEQGVAIGFNERLSRIALVHQEGLVDRVDRTSRSPTVKYAKRELLGFTDAEIALIESEVLNYLN
ncbi:phage virion morphogenesis protein [Acinetobacter rathckeae]|uniref:phage virion morphogenesis protein n=1 Tax=Acinetobacter rathckeae TaxID=2605272 RepID=UPI0018A2F240|nr:phage virion morphogenesis protein [Acinetobacter rathckeae]MBF7687743.1 phage virion morphogenesis protein [Acinetobacter rathckeae]MBF7688034.1 phage virion morphogenesis protein [Acinetobacter rathckeae]